MSNENKTDYSRRDRWYSYPEITKDVDAFYIYGTMYVRSSAEEGAPDHAAIDNPEMLERVPGDYEAHASVFEDSANVFVPFYRQAGLRFAGETIEKTGDIDAAISGIPYEDITGALDWYFENCNGGRPFIIAGHSQGSAMVRLVLKKYFKEHPDRYARMIAAYVIGFSITRDDLEAFPHLKFAAGETDTGVIISWNTEGWKNVEEEATNSVLLPNAISINPLNWKLDDTYAPASENLGSYKRNRDTGKYEIIDAGADAQVVPERGVIVTNAKAEPKPEGFIEIPGASSGPDGRHDSDYAYYYNNIKDNAAKRIRAFKEGR